VDLAKIGGANSSKAPDTLGSGVSLSFKGREASFVM
jgi:hypothetical protein